jgi:hypothetical protein
MVYASETEVIFLPTVIGVGPVQFRGSFGAACAYVWRRSRKTALSS